MALLRAYLRRSGLRYAISQRLPPIAPPPTLLATNYWALPLVARTVGLLVEKGLLYRVGGPLGRRASLLAVTPRGRELLRHDPYTAVVSVVETMPTGQRTVLATTSSSILCPGSGG